MVKNGWTVDCCDSWIEDIKDDILKDVEYGDMFETESGRKVVFVGYPFNRTTNDKEYLGFMFQGNMELSLYKQDCSGPYGFSVGSGSILPPQPMDKLVKKIKR